MSDHDTQHYPTTVRGNKQTEWLIKQAINEGSFGAVFTCVNKNTGQRAAIKFEKEGIAATQIHYEYQIYKQLKSDYFPQVLDAGNALNQNNVDYKYMIMELVGEDLSHVRHRSTKYKLKLFEKTMRGIEALHNQGYIHRDIKPKNLCLAIAKSPNVKIVDLGLAKRYVSIEGKHIKNQLKKSHVGTMRYASYNSTAYTQSSRRDDIESLIYTFVNIFNKKLPWQSSKDFATKKKKTQFIHTLKTICSPRRVCKGLPSCFERILINAKHLHFNEKPPYFKYYTLIQADIDKF